MRERLWLFFLAPAVAITAVEQVSQMLVELRATAETASAKAASDHTRLSTFCDSTSSETQNSVDALALELVAAEAATGEQRVAVSSEQTAAAEALQETSDLERSREAEQQAGEQAAKEYKAALQEYDAALEAVSQAQQIFALQDKAAPSLLQGTLAHVKQQPRARALLEEARALGTPSAWEQDEHLFDGMDVASQPYESRSGGVVSALASVASSLSQEREELVTTEAARRRAYEETMTALQAQAETARAAYQEHVGLLQHAEAALAEAETHQAQTQKAKDSTDAFLADHQRSCAAELAGYTEQEKVRQLEVQALGQALAAINGKLSLVRVKKLGLVHVASTVRHPDLSAAAEKIGSFLRAEARHGQFSDLSRIADRAFEVAAQPDETDPLAAVKAMIENLVIKLKQQNIDEAEHKAYCDTELATNEHTVTTAEAGTKEHTAALAALEGEYGKLQLTVNETQAELSERTAARTVAQAAREAAHTNATSTIQEADEARDAVKAAMDILTAFYSNTSNFPEPPASSENVLSMLEVVRDDYAGASTKLQARETAAAALHHETDTAAAVSVAALETDLSHGQQRLVDLEQAIPATRSALNISSSELAQGKATYEGLHPICVAPESFEDRKAARETELAGLNAALEMFASATLLQSARAPPLQLRQRVEQDPDPAIVEAVTRLVSLLESVKADVEADIAADRVMYEEMQTWCTENGDREAAFLAESVDRESQLGFLIEEKTAEIARLEVEVAKLQEDIATATGALEQATTLRTTEHEAYQEESKKLIESITALQGAIVVLSRHQRPENATELATAQLRSDVLTGRADVQSVLHAFPAAVSAVEAQTVLRAFQPSEWRDAPASVTTYQPQTSVVFGILSQMLEQFQQDAKDAQGKEESAQALFEDVKKSKEEEISTFVANEQMKSANLAQARLTLASSQEEVVDVRQAITSARALIAQIKTQCTDFETQYVQRNATRTSELTSLEEAIGILTSSEAQATLSGTSTATALHVAAAPTRTQAPVATAAPTAPPPLSPQAVLAHFIRKHRVEAKARPASALPAKAREPEAKADAKAQATPAAKPQATPAAKAEATPAAEAAATLAKAVPAPPAPVPDGHSPRARSLWHALQPRCGAPGLPCDPRALLQTLQQPEGGLAAVTKAALQTVIEQIAPLVVVLEEEKLQEVQAHDLCISELNNAGLRQEEKNSTLIDVRRRLTQETVQAEGTQQAISVAESEVVAMRAALNQTAHERELQHAEFAKQVKGQQDVVTLLSDALWTLQKLVQKKAVAVLATGQTPSRTALAPAPQFAKERGHGAGGVVAILELLKEESEGLVAEIVEAEEQAQAAYMTEVNSMTKSVGEKERLMIALQDTFAQQNQRKAQLEASVVAVLKEMEQLDQYMHSVHGKCDWLLENFADNQAHREAEMQQLREAKAFLAGKMQQAFLQRRQR